MRPSTGSDVGTTRRRVAPALVLLLLGGAWGSAAAQDPGEDDPGAAVRYPEPRYAEGPLPSAPCVLRAELVGIVNPGTAAYLGSALEAAAEKGCGALLVRLDTPGGLLDATRGIVQRFLEAPVPVIVHVAPAGARAGSAGVFITLAAHVAAMAPGSNIGAAHPVTGTGGDPEDAGGEELARKIENDTAALARAIAERRQRNVAWAEDAVRKSVSATAREARDDHVIDLLVRDEGALLEQVHGRLVEVRGEEVAIRTEGAPVVEHPMTISQRARMILGDPSVTYALLSLGFLALLLELYNPGMLVPGALGVLCLLLGGIGLEVLPVNLGAVLLLAVAIGLLIAELYVTSFGLLALAGVGCLALGAALLIDRSDPGYLVDPSFGISWLTILPLAAVVGLAAVALGFQAAKEQRKRSSTGAEGLEGAEGVVADAIPASGEGWVRIHGERWRARADAAVSPGTPIRVRRVVGLVLEVEPGSTG
jgi:membrane-bound serine protease (ClpP class)